MHLFGPSASISRTRRGQDVRKTSIDDIGINYGSSTRVFEWNQAFETAVDVNSMRMFHAGYHSNGTQGPTSAMSSSEASPMSMQEFPSMDAFSPISQYDGQQMSSGYMTMALDHNATPPPAIDINYAHAPPLERAEEKLDTPSPYSSYHITSGTYPYSEYVHEDDDRTVLHQNLPQETGVSPEYAHSMSIYQQELESLCS